MDRSKLVAVITGAIAIAISILYLLLVQILDFRTEMVPAPQSVNPTGAIADTSASFTGD
ncbi:MAG TPA: hypothetical protein V6C46_07425 [Coleofasciculaceae cyanobacterium]